MNILLHDFGSYIQPDLIACLSEMGHHCKNLVYPLPNPLEDAYYEKYITAHLNSGQYDCVISTNFLPLLARICYQHNIKYLAWSYDSPLSREYMEYYTYPTSYLFLFDRMEVEDLHNIGLTNVYHLPLAVNTKRLSSITITDADRERFTCDLSFVGNFYQSQLKKILSFQDDHTIGYINALTDAQFKFSEVPLLEDIIDDTLLKQINDALTEEGIVFHSGQEPGINKTALILSMNYQITHNERIILLRLMNQFCRVHLYSTEIIEQLSEIPFKGPVTYSLEMPKVFRLSRINLCPTMRNIRSGIPLRALDIMGAGGFILCNPQPELMEYFRPDNDIICYNNMEDAVEKPRFYLAHEEARIKIQQNAYAVIRERFTYPERIAFMFQTACL
ncbi:MAG: glycosyltransferase [Acetatifactor sp.]|nr:glycosyltransferase [Acetatifactor sp.]